MRISEVADRVGIPASTVRYYERIGLLPGPARTPSGYRDYDEEAAARLLFVTRARRMGLTLEQVAELLPIWGGVNCGVTHEAVTRLIDRKRAEVLERIGELRRFADQLDEIHATLEGSPPPPACLPDLSCCVPHAEDEAPSTPIALLPAQRRRN